MSGSVSLHLFKIPSQIRNVLSLSPFRNTQSTAQCSVFLASSKSLNHAVLCSLSLVSNYYSLPSCARAVFFSPGIFGWLSSSLQNEFRDNTCLALSLCASSKQIIESLMFCLSRPFKILGELHNILSFWPLQNSSRASRCSVFLASPKSSRLRFNVLGSLSSVLPTIYKSRRLWSFFFLYPHKYLKYPWIFYFQNRV